jgi:allantoinase
VLAILGAGHRERGLALETIARVSAGYAARRLRLPGKGRLQPGADADLALADLGAQPVLRAQDLLYRHPHSPFVGHRLGARIVRTLVRGRTVFADGRVVGTPGGRLVTPDPQERRS